MTTEQASLFLSLLSFTALAIAVVVTGLMVAGRTHKLAPLRDLLVPLALAVAVISTLGSLYYSAIVHFTPCRLCWWQRIAMYPLVPILAVGLFRRDRAAGLYALPLSLMGLGWAGYHTQLRWWPEQGSSCEIDAACTSVWVNTFGFVSIPFMAGAGFLAITALLIASLRLDRHDVNSPANHPDSITRSSAEVTQ